MKRFPSFCIFNLIRPSHSCDFLITYSYSIKCEYFIREKWTILTSHKNSSNKLTRIISPIYSRIFKVEYRNWRLMGDESLWIYDCKVKLYLYFKFRLPVPNTNLNVTCPTNVLLLNKKYGWRILADSAQISKLKLYSSFNSLNCKQNVGKTHVITFHVHGTTHTNTHIHTRTHTHTNTTDETTEDLTGRRERREDNNSDKQHETNRRDFEKCVEWMSDESVEYE